MDLKCRLLVWLLVVLVPGALSHTWEELSLLGHSQLIPGLVTAGIQELPHQDTCCRKQYRIQTINRVIVYNEVEYKCTGRIYQPYCGGDCQVESQYTSAVYAFNEDGKLVTVTKPSYTSGDKTYCQFKGNPETHTRRLRCKAQRDCCENVNPEIYVDVKIEVPTECECKILTTTPPPPPSECKPVRRRQYHWFWLDDTTYCRTDERILIPYCDGVCKSYHLQYYFGFPLYKPYDWQYCQCCTATRYGQMTTKVYCWLNIDKETLERAGTTVTMNGVRETNLDIFTAAWYGEARVSYVSDCACRYTNCK